MMLPSRIKDKVMLGQTLLDVSTFLFAGQGGQGQYWVTVAEHFTNGNRTVDHIDGYRNTTTDGAAHPLAIPELFYFIPKILSFEPFYYTIVVCALTHIIGFDPFVQFDNP